MSTSRHALTFGGVLRQVCAGIECQNHEKNAGNGLHGESRRVGGMLRAVGVLLKTREAFGCVGHTGNGTSDYRGECFPANLWNML